MTRRFFAPTTGAVERPAQATDPHVWDLTDLYASSVAWSAAREGVLATLPSIEAR